MKLLCAMCSTSVYPQPIAEFEWNTSVPLLGYFKTTNFTGKRRNNYEILPINHIIQGWAPTDVDALGVHEAQSNPRHQAGQEGDEGGEEEVPEVLLGVQVGDGHTLVSPGVVARKG